MKKKVVSLLLTALMATSLVACGGDKKTDDGKKTSDKTEDGEEITLTVWGPQEDQTSDADENKGWLQEQCEAFAAEHPEWKITFNYGVCGEDKAGEEVTKDADAAADVFMFANDQISTLVSANALAELGGDTLDEIKKNNSDGVVTSLTYNGSVYGVPFTSNTWYMYYDKSVFSEDDVKNLDTMLTKGKVSFPVGNGWYVPAIYFANGCTMFGEDGTDADKFIEFGGDNGAAATKYMINMMKNPNFVYNADDNALCDQFKTKDGSLNACFSGSWKFSEFKEAYGDDLGVAVVPTITVDGAEKQLMAFAGSKAIGVNAKSKNPKQAVALAAYLGGEKAQTAHWEERQIVPTYTSLNLGDAVGADMIAVQNAEMESTHSKIQPVQDYKNYWNAAGTLSAGIADGSITEANAAEKTEEWVKSFEAAVEQ